MGIAINDVPWKDDLVTAPIEIGDGQISVPSGSGWAGDLNEVPRPRG